MSVPLRFADPQYVNWLKCASSLVILKESLHDYTGDGVRRLHDNVRRSVTTQLGAQLECSDCSFKGIYQQKSTLDWYIKCKKNICNVWLSEILNKHNDSQCKTINWRNADITKWSTDPWEMAKIFMTKGQWNNVNLPQELDSPALLSLLKYCKEFDPIDVQLVSTIIDTRNNVLHSPDLRVCDADKDAGIDNMLSLVQNLNIQGVVYTDIYKLKTEDIDVSFRDQELKVLQKLASEIRNEVTALKGDSESLKNTQSELREEIEKVKGTVGDNKAKIIGLQTQNEQLENDLRGQKSQMELCVQVFSSFKGFIDKNPDLSNIKLSEELSATSKAIHSLQSQLQTVESQLVSFNGELIIIRADQEKMKTEMRVEHQAVKEEVTAVKDEQEKMKMEMRVKHQAVKEEITAVKDEQEKMKTEMRVEHLAVKEEISAVKNQIEILEQDQRQKQTGSSNMEVRNHAQSSEQDIQELFNKFDSILKFVASKSGGVKAIDVGKNCNLGPLKKDANPLLYFLEDKQLLVCEQVAGSQKKLWKLGPKTRPIDQELREYAAEKLAKGKRY